MFWLGFACGVITAWVLFGCLFLVYLIRAFRTWG
jgi:hypothetical protein